MDDQSKLFVGGIIRAATEVDIINYFSRFGKVKNVDLKRSSEGASKGFGFVEMQTPLLAELVLRVPVHMIGGQLVDVKRVVKQKKENMIFVGGLSRSTTDEMLKAYFNQFGRVVECNVRLDSSGGPRGFGFVMFASPETVDKVTAIENHTIEGKRVEAKPMWKSPKEKQEALAKARSSNADSTSKVFVGGLDVFATNEDSLNQYFSQFGTVRNVSIKRDPETGKSRGFGFVTFADSDSLDEVMNSRPHTIDERSVDTKRVVPNAKPEDLVTVKSLFVGGLKAGHNEHNLREYFQQFGNVIRINIPKPGPDQESTTGHRGFCFIEFDDYDAVDRAILQKEHIIDGISVDLRKGLSKDDKAKVEQSKREREIRELRSSANVTNGVIDPFPSVSTHFPGADMTGGFSEGISPIAGLPMGSGALVQSVSTGRAIPKVPIIKGPEFRAILQRTDVSMKALNILDSENLLDSSVLLSLTKEEFKELPLSLGDRKRIENALRENFRT